jgi:Fibronectin type III domain
MRTHLPPLTRAQSKTVRAVGATLVLLLLIVATVWGIVVAVPGLFPVGSGANGGPPSVPTGSGAAPLANPANCSQGANAIHATPQGGDSYSMILQDFDTLGSEGGGTLYLGAGTYFVNQTLNFHNYDNVSIQGAGPGSTVISLPVDPIGNFTADNGTALGLYNATTGGATNGTTMNFINVNGPPIDNFELCNLQLNAQATSAAEDWSGSLLADNSGGSHHVYSDISIAGLYGPQTTPNGIHLNSAAPAGINATGYIVDDLSTGNYPASFLDAPGHTNGPNFLNVGPIQDCTLYDIAGQGQVAFEVAPPTGCLAENWNITGRLVIDPVTGGSWGGTTFTNVSIDAAGTPEPNAAAVSVHGDGYYGSNFTGLRWTDDTFVGTILGGENMVDVEGSRFYGGISPVPATFVNSTVVWTDSSFVTLPLPLELGGSPTGGEVSVVTGDTFDFPNGTHLNDPFQLTVSDNTWRQDTISITGSASVYLICAPNVTLAQTSTFSDLHYDAIGTLAPLDMLFFDVPGSPGFVDRGAAVWGLDNVFDTLPVLTPSPPGVAVASSSTPTGFQLIWAPSFGPVTRYVVLVGTTESSLTTVASVGNHTEFAVSGLTGGEQYFFAIRAWNGSYPSVMGAIGSTTTPVWSPGVPGSPVIQSRASNALTLAWQPASGIVTAYTVSFGTSADSLSRTISVGNVTSCNVTGLAPSTEYFLEVEAWNESWNSTPTPIVGAMTLGASGGPPGAGSGLAARPWSLEDAFSVMILGTVVAVATVGPILGASLWRTARRRRRR